MRNRASDSVVQEGGLSRDAAAPLWLEHVSPFEDWRTWTPAGEFYGAAVEVMAP